MVSLASFNLKTRWGSVFVMSGVRHFDSKRSGLQKGAPERFSTPLLLLHWIIAVSLVIGVVGIELRDFLHIENPVRPYLRQLHYLTGFFVFWLLWYRIYVRLRDGVPPSLSNPLATWVARLVQGAMYLLMIVQPVLGLLSMQSGGRKLEIGLWQFPVLIGENADVNDLLKETHYWLGFAFMFLVFIHVSGALFSHYISRDATLRRMLGGGRG